MNITGDCPQIFCIRSAPRGEISVMDLPWFSVAKPAWINIAPEKTFLALSRLNINQAVNSHYSIHLIRSFS